LKARTEKKVDHQPTIGHDLEKESEAEAETVTLVDIDIVQHQMMMNETRKVNAGESEEGDTGKKIGICVTTVIRRRSWPTMIKFDLDPRHHQTPSVPVTGADVNRTNIGNGTEKRGTSTETKTRKMRENIGLRISIVLAVGTTMTAHEVEIETETVKGSGGVNSVTVIAAVDQ